MNTAPLRILLADDDEDDCFFFNEALADLPAPTTLTIVNDGEQLMELLRQPDTAPPQVLFLDLNMPRLSGIECLTEIRHDAQLSQIPVIVLSTFFGADVEAALYALGARYCLRKPAQINRLSKVITEALALAMPEILSPVLVADSKPGGGPAGNTQ